MSEVFKKPKVESVELPSESLLCFTDSDWSGNNKAASLGDLIPSYSSSSKGVVTN